MSSSPAVRHFSSAGGAASSAASLSFSQAKTRLKSEYDPDKALEIYSSVSKHSSSPLSSRYAQEYTVRRLAKARRFPDIKTFLQSHINDSNVKDEDFVSGLIRSYAVATMFHESLATYNQMEKLGTPRTSVSFNVLLTGFLSGNKFDDVVQMFDEMPHRHAFKPDEVSYGILIKAYCSMGKVDLAMDRLKEMEEKGLEITSIAYTTVLHSLIRKGRTEEGEKLWNVMVSKGRADVVAYNVRIMQAHSGDVEGVKGLIEEMSKNGLKPDTITYNYLITSYCKGNLMDEAIKVFYDMKSNGCKPNAATYRTLVFHLCKNNRFETAHNVCKKSFAARKIPDFNTLKYLVQGLVKNSKMEEAKQIILCIKKKSPPHVVKAWEELEEELGLVIAPTDGGDCSYTVGSEKIASV